MTDTTTSNTPPVIQRYFQASGTNDVRGLVDCFTDDARVSDEGKTYRGRDDIMNWWEGSVSEWIYTTTVTGSQSVSATEHLLMVHIAGNFPGGEANLTFHFTLRDGLVASLEIG